MLQIGILIQSNYDKTLANKIYQVFEKNYEIVTASDYELTNKFNFLIPKMSLFDKKENQEVNHITYFNESKCLIVLCQDTNLIENFILGINNEFLLACLSAFRHNIYFCINNQSNTNNIKQLSIKLNNYSSRFKIISIDNDYDIETINKKVNYDFQQKKLLNLNLLVLSCEEISQVDDVRVIKQIVDYNKHLNLVNNLIKLGSNVTWINNFVDTLRGATILKYQNFSEFIKYVNLYQSLYDAVIIIGPKQKLNYNNFTHGKINSQSKLSLNFEIENLQYQLLNTIHIDYQNNQTIIYKNTLQNELLNEKLLNVLSTNR